MRVDLKVITMMIAMALSDELWAQSQEPPREPEPALSDISLEEAKQIALRHVPGEIVDVGEDTWNEQPVWEVEVESEDGWDYVVYINPENGRIVQVDG